MDKKTSLKINNRKETVFGLAAVGLSICSLFLFFWVVYQTAYNSTGREVLIGSVELLAMLFCLVGLIFGLIGETRVHRFRLSAHIGIAANIVVGIFHVLVLLNAFGG